jgi:transcriptional regulator with XRE-family HTH domain
MDGGCCVGKPIGDQVGRALRRARLTRGLTLRDVGTRSGGIFTPTAVAGYERGERAISLQRFCQLAAFYDVAPEDLLAEALQPDDREPVVDLTPLEEPTHTPSA